MASKAGMATGVEVARISVKVSPDTKEFRRELKRDLEKIEHSMRAQIDVEPDMDRFRSKVNAGTKGLRATVHVDVDRNSLSQVQDSLSKLKPQKMQLPIGGGIPGGPYSMAAAGAAALSLAAPALGLITTSLLTLPGLIAAVAVPVAALTLGMDGLKKAAERLKAPFEDLKASMSSAVESQFSPVFDKLGAILPTLKSALPRVTQGMADIAQSFADTVTSSAGMEKINRTIENIGTALSNAAPGVGAFTDGLMTLVEKFSAKLPAISTWFNDLGGSFKSWVDKITAVDSADGTSRFDRAMKYLGDSLREVVGLVKDLAGQGLNFMADPEFGKKTQEFLNGIRTFITDTMPALKTQFEDLATVVKSIGDAWGAINWAVLPGAKLSELAGQMNDNRKPGAKLPEDAGLVDKGLARVQDVFNGMSFNDVLLKPFTDFIGVAKTLWESVWNADFMSGIREQLSGAWDGFKTDMANLGPSISAWATDMKTQLSGAWEAFKADSSAAWGSVKSTVSSAWESIKSSVSSGISTVVSFMAGLPGQITGAIGDLSGTLVAAGKALIDGLLSGIKSALGAVLDFASGIAAKIAAVKGPLPYDRTVLVPAGQALMEGLGTGLQDGLKDVLKNVKGMAGQINQEVSSALGLNETFDLAGKLGAVPTDFAKATGQQFLSDIGISGGGVVSKAVTEGINYVFQIGSVDEALSIKDREESKKALSVVGRQ